MIYFKKHQRVYGNRTSTIVAMCDADLIGKKLKSGNAVLDLATYAGFYKGEAISVEQAGKILSENVGKAGGGVSFNLVGKQVMAAAAKFANVSRAKKFGAVPHLQVYSV